MLNVRASPGRERGILVCLTNFVTLRPKRMPAGSEMLHADRKPVRKPTVRTVSKTGAKTDGIYASNRYN